MKKPRTCKISKRPALKNPHAPIVVSARKLRAMKRVAQARDRALIAQGGPIDEQFLISPELARGAKIVSPDADLASFLDDWEAKHGEFTSEELARATKELAVTPKKPQP